jgi:hypothetical protein
MEDVVGLIPRLSVVADREDRLSVTDGHGREEKEERSTERHGVFQKVQRVQLRFFLVEGRLPGCRGGEPGA